MKVLEAYAEFSRNYLMARMYSQQTIDGYWWVIRSFVQSAGNLETTDINISVYSDWIQFMDGKGNTKATIHSNVSRFRVFIEYLNLQELCYLGKEQIVPPRKPRSLPKFTTPETVDKMISHSNSVRDKAIVAVFFSTGLRNAELRNLKINDIYDRDVLVNQGKGLRDRVVRLDNRSFDLLSAYMASRMDSAEYLFISNRGQPIASSTMRYIIAAATQRAGLPKTHPHAIRHGTATHMLRGGANIRIIQDYLGHQNVSTTELYTHVTNEDVKKSHSDIFDK